MLCCTMSSVRMCFSQIVHCVCVCVRESSVVIIESFKMLTSHTYDSLFSPRPLYSCQRRAQSVNLFANLVYRVLISLLLPLMTCCMFEVVLCVHLSPLL